MVSLWIEKLLGETGTCVFENPRDGEEGWELYWKDAVISKFVNTSAILRKEEDVCGIIIHE